MSQSATFYNVKPSALEQVINSAFEINTYCDSQITLTQSHEGINYILLKIAPSVSNHINELFNPSNYSGNLPDFSDEDADLDSLLENPPVFYISPEQVNEIAAVLTPISNQDITNNYSADEFNKNGIYPEIWNNSTAPDLAFNLSYLLEEFNALKAFLTAAASQNNYLIVYVG